MQIEPGFLLFLGDAISRADAKTAFGLRDWRQADCIGQWRLAGCAVDLGIPDLTPSQAKSAGAKTLVIGIAPDGGAIADSWVTSIASALDAGLDVASGMHARLSDIPQIAAAAARAGRKLIDVRHSAQSFAVASGRKRRGRRLLTVGTDCAVGKKYTALQITRALRTTGIAATFRATGQTGIMLAGAGVPIDAVVGDFIAGAAESLSPDNDASHWDVIEGQGSLFHPSYAAVSLGLLHGSQPDALVVCHDAARERIDGHGAFPVPALADCMDLNLRCARLTNADVYCVGISINTSAIPAEQRAAYLEDIARTHGVPCFDPMIDGAETLVAHLLATF